MHICPYHHCFFWCRVTKALVKNIVSAFGEKFTDVLHFINVPNDALRQLPTKPPLPLDGRRSRKLDPWAPPRLTKKTDGLRN